MEPKVHYRVHNIPPLDRNLSQLKPLHILIYCFKIHFYILTIYARVSQVALSFGFTD
jgi:hypothetical protein